MDLKGRPERTRFIARRERLHPGAQRSLFDSELWRYRGSCTDAAGDPAELDAHMRAHAHIEDTIARLKDSGLARMPFGDFDANSAWTNLVALSLSLVRWFQQLCLDGELAKAAPKRLRWQLWHAPARLVRSARNWTLRLLDWWPTTPQLLAAHHSGAPHSPTPHPSPAATPPEPNAPRTTRWAPEPAPRPHTPHNNPANTPPPTNPTTEITPKYTRPHHSRILVNDQD